MVGTCGGRRVLAQFPRGGWPIASARAVAPVLIGAGI
jgi:hypothetical protein